jgi:hypothetical protein
LDWAGGFGSSAEIAEVLPCHEALGAADDLSLALSFGGAALNVAESGLVGAQTHDHDMVEGGVGLTMGLNNHAENSHQPTRRRERQMKHFKSAGEAQCFFSAHGGVNTLFYLRHNHLIANEYCAARTHAFEVWSDIGGVAVRA